MSVPWRGLAAGGDVVDVLYVAGSVAFFALMIGYVHACERLGAPDDAEERQP